MSKPRRVIPAIVMKESEGVPYAELRFPKNHMIAAGEQYSPSASEIISVFNGARNTNRQAAWPLPNETMVQPLQRFMGAHIAFRKAGVAKMWIDDAENKTKIIRSIERHLRSALKDFSKLPRVLADVENPVRFEGKKEIKSYVVEEIKYHLKMLESLSNKNTGLLSANRHYISAASLELDAGKVIVACWKQAGCKNPGIKSENSPAARVLEYVVKTCTGRAPQSVGSLAKRVSSRERKRAK